MPDEEQKSMIDEAVDFLKSSGKAISKLFKPIKKIFKKDVKEE